MTRETGLCCVRLLASEQRVEDRPRNHVLGEHCCRVVPPDGVVEVVAERSYELVEPCTNQSVWVLYERADAFVVAAGDVGDGVGPPLPVATLSAAFDDQRDDGGAQLARGRSR